VLRSLSYFQSLINFEGFLADTRKVGGNRRVDVKQKRRRRRLVQEDYTKTCAWCLRRIPEEHERFGFGAKALPDDDIVAIPNLLHGDACLSRVTFVIPDLMREAVNCRMCQYTLISSGFFTVSIQTRRM
jgi:hypothetical protein